MEYRNTSGRAEVEYKNHMAAEKVAAELAALLDGIPGYVSVNTLQYAQIEMQEPTEDESDKAESILAAYCDGKVETYFAQHTGQHYMSANKDGVDIWLQNVRRNCEIVAVQRTETVFQARCLETEMRA